MTRHRLPPKPARCMQPSFTRAVPMLLLLLWALPQPLRAQIPTEPTEADARTGPRTTAELSGSQQDYDHLVSKALTAYQQGQWAVALRAFQKAHALRPSARTLRTMGMCAFNLADYPKALLWLERSAKDPRRPLNGKQRMHVQQLAREARREVAQVSLVTNPPLEDAATLSIDGQPPLQTPEGTILLQPGSHRISIQRPSHQAVHYPITAQAGHLSRVTIDLPTGPSAKAPEGISRPTGEVRTMRVLGFVALSVGAGSLVASGVTAALALDRHSDLKEGCFDGRCPPDQHDELRDYHLFKTVSTVTFYGGLATALTGGLFLLLDAQAPHTDAVARGAPAEPPPFQIGPTGVLWRGTL